jgi:hypothetical protein
MQASNLQDGFAVYRLSNTSQLESLQTEWTKLVEDIPDVPLFLSWEWTSTWWKHYQDRGDLWLLTIRNHLGDLVGIAPWVLRGTSGHLFKLRTLTFLFDLPPVHLDILSRPEDMDLVCSALLDYLKKVKNEWDLLNLRGLSETSCLHESLARQPGHFQEREGLICTYITLPQDWESFEKKSLSANRRKQIRSNQRHLERDHPGEVLFRRIDDRAEIQTALDLLIQFNRDKWRERDGVSAFEDERYRKFNRAIADEAFKYGWLRFYELKVGQQLLSSRLCFSYHGVYVDFQTAFNQQWSHYAPGELLLVYVLKDAIREGAHEFDFLPGTYRWKMSWSTGLRQEKHILFGHNWRSFRSFVTSAFLDRAVVMGRKALPETARERINLLISRIKHRTQSRTKSENNISKS